MDTLTEEQIEQAAQSSYAYWVATQSRHQQPPTDKERRKMAQRECRRHLVKRPLDDAVQDIAETLAYRKVRGTSRGSVISDNDDVCPLNFVFLTYVLTYVRLRT